MATFSSDTVTLSAPAKSVYDKLSNPENLRALLENAPKDQIPDDKRALLEQIQITSNEITIPGGPTGPITLRSTRKVEPTLLEMEGIGTPAPITLALHLNPQGEESCEARIDLDIQIPKMLVPMIKGPLQNLVDQVSVMFKSIPWA